MKRNIKIVISTAIAAAAILSTFGYLHFYPNNVTSSNGNLQQIELGPKLAVSVNNSPTNPSIANNTTISLQVFGSFPVYVMPFQTIYTNLTGLNSSNNDHLVQLLNVTVSSGTSILFLSPKFLNIANSWQNFFGDPSWNSLMDYPSLTVEAAKSVYVNGSVYIYPYFGSLLYNPHGIAVNIVNQLNKNSMNVSQWFNGSNINPTNYKSINYTALEFYLSLAFSSTPSQVLRYVAPPPSGITNARPDEKAISSATSGSYYYWQASFKETVTPTGIVTVNGYLPLLAVHLGRGTVYGGSQIVLGASIDLQNTAIGIDSTQTSWSQTGQVTSSLISGPSYVHVASAKSVPLVNAYSAIPLNLSEEFNNNYSVSINQTTAYVAIQNTTYSFEHFSISESEYNNEYLVTWHLKSIWIDGREYWMNVASTTLEQSILVNTTHIGNASDGGITSITQNGQGNLQLAVGYLPIEVNQVMQNLSEQNPSSNLSLTTAGPSHSLSALSFWTSDSAWTNASQIISDFGNLFTSIAVGLSLGLAISDALAPGGPRTEPGIVAESMDIIGAALAVGSLILSQFTTIGFVANAQSVSMGYSVTNEPWAGSGSNYRFVYYQSQSPMQMSFDGKVFQFYAPSNYINVTGIVNVSTITNNLIVSTPENNSQSNSNTIYQSSGVWQVDPNNPQVEYANYNISHDAQYMAGNVFNQWQDFAFQPGNATDGYRDVYYAVGNVSVNLINSDNEIVASWHHNFGQRFSNDNSGSDWVYINPTFNIPNGTIEPIVMIQFVNNITGFGQGWQFYGIGNGGLISFANAAGNVNTYNNPEPAGTYESSLAWYGYNTISKSITWTNPTNTLYYMILWSSPYYTEVSYNGETQFGTEGIFIGSLNTNSLNTNLGCWIPNSEEVEISEIFVVP